jgi:hypothetical protein
MDVSPPLLVVAMPIAAYPCQHASTSSSGINDQSHPRHTMRNRGTGSLPSKSPSSMPPARKITSATHRSLSPEATFIVLCNALYSKRNELIYSNFSELIGGNAFESRKYRVFDDEIGHQRWNFICQHYSKLPCATTPHNHNTNLGRSPPNVDLNRPPKA